MVQEYGFGTMIMVIINDSVQGGHDCFLSRRTFACFNKLFAQDPLPDMAIDL
jgi:hypothetical protein